MDGRRVNRGKIGENIAVEYMTARGFMILARNYRRMGCEVDVVARDGDVLSFVEVKARSGGAMGAGREAVTRAKQRNIIKAAKCYLMENGVEDTAVRFDVAEVALENRAVEYIENAFEV